MRYRISVIQQFTCLFLACCTFYTASAQENININTVNEYQHSLQPKADTTAILELLKHARKVQYTASDSSILLVKYALIKSRQINFIRGNVNALTLAGILYMEKGMYEQSIEMFNEALSLCEKLPASYYKREKICMLYGNVSLTYSYLGDNISSGYYRYRALETIKKVYPPDTALLIAQYNSMGSFWSYLSFSHAQYYLNMGEELAKRRKYNNQLAQILINKGNLYFKEQKLVLAKSLATEALSLAEHYQLHYEKQIALMLLGGIAIQEKTPENAIPYFKKVIELNKHERIYRNKVLAFYSLADAYYQSKDYKHAEAILLPTIKEAKTLGLKENIAYPYHTLASVYEATGRYKQALQYQKAYIDIRDSILDKAQIQTNNRLEVELLTTEKDREISQKKQEINRQNSNIQTKNILIAVISVCILLLTGLFISLYRNYHRKVHILQQQQQIVELKAMIKGEEKERKRIAGELHDGVVGQLAAIKMNISVMPRKNQKYMLEDFRDVMQQIDETSAELRTTAHNLMPDVLLQGGLVEALKVFCNKISKNGVLEISYQVLGTIPKLQPDFELSIYRIVQELVQNIIKHAKATLALVQLSCQNDILTIVVEDNGIGMNKEAANKNNGMGLANLSTRIKTYNGHWEFESEEDAGTTISIEFDINHYEKTI